MRQAPSGGFTAVLVQSRFAETDYLSPGAFRDKVMALCAGLAPAPAPPRLIVFPEHTGLWLPLLRRGAPRSLSGLAAGLALRRLPAAAVSLASGGGLSPFFRADWRWSLESWLEPFREAARKLEAYICPGSMLLPRFDGGPVRGWRARGRGVYGTSCLINPRGAILGMTRKIHPSRGERLLGMRGATLEEQLPYQTELGRIGILLGTDGFHEAAVQQMDRLGCRLLLQPSASALPWSRPRRRGAQTREELWLSSGLGRLIQGRENAGLALTAMSASRVLGREEQGRSSVFVNPARGVTLRGARRLLPEGYRRYTGLEAIAASCDSEEILSVQARV
jgi:predicted amidohydrolase